MLNVNRRSEAAGVGSPLVVVEAGEDAPVQFRSRAVSPLSGERPLVRCGALTAYEAEALAGDVRPLGPGAVLDVELTRTDAESLLLMERTVHGLRRRGITVRIQKLAS